jgi:hypothetical protein
MPTIKIDDMSWRRKTGATSTAEEFRAARQVFCEIMMGPESDWSPWIADNRHEELDAAEAVMKQWERADPGFHYLTKEELEAELDAKAEKRRAEREVADRERAARQAESAKHYSAERYEARLALLEAGMWLGHFEEELAGLDDGSRFPAMGSDRRANERQACVDRLTELREKIDSLTPIVGDPESVVDEAGRTPGDWREITLTVYSARRHVDVRELRKEITELDQQLAATSKTERRELRDKKQDLERKLRRHLDVPPLKPDDMCADCYEPLMHHGTTYPPGWSCPAWPGERKKHEEVRQLLASWDVERRRQRPGRSPSQPRRRRRRRSRSSVPDYQSPRSRSGSRSCRNGTPTPWSRWAPVTGWSCGRNRHRECAVATSRPTLAYAGVDSRSDIRRAVFSATWTNGRTPSHRTSATGGAKDLRTASNLRSALGSSLELAYRCDRLWYRGPPRTGPLRDADDRSPSREVTERCIART